MLQTYEISDRSLSAGIKIKKQVLLGERKRHTAHRIASASARYAYCSVSRLGGGRYPIQSWTGGGTPSIPGGGIP